MQSCPRPDPDPKAPRRVRMPPLACDSHAHICGPESLYPYSPARVYTPPDALLSDYRRMLDTLGVQRGVLVQPSVYGVDNRALLDGLSADPANLRGVAVLDEHMTDAGIEAMHKTGVRGARINIVDLKEGKGVLPLDSLRALARRISPFGWHMEFLMHVDEFPDLDRLFGDFPVETVFGHLGYMRTERSIEDPGFQALLRLMRAGRAWAKLSGPYRITSRPLPYEDTVAYAHALLEANARQVVWGTDWPHVILKGKMPNDGDLCDVLADWVPDERLRNQVLVDNPARLYGF
jgi:predicted TIM-barrel fold metal-dependent hydrolase